jgi:hypothetical protein
MTGITIGIPKRILSVTRSAQFGIDYLSPDERFQVGLRVFNQGSDVRGYFEGLKVAFRGAYLQYSQVWENRFVLSGAINNRKFYLRYHARDGMLAGFFAVYDDRDPQFSRRRIGSEYQGTAYAFAKGCEPIPYEVSGRVVSEEEIVMTGLVPIVARSNCLTVGHRSNQLRFALRRPEEDKSPTVSGTVQRTDESPDRLLLDSIQTFLARSSARPPRRAAAVGGAIRGSIGDRLPARSSVSIKYCRAMVCR